MPRVKAVPDEGVAPARRIGRTIAWVLAILVLVGTGVLGVRNGVTEWSGADTGWRKSVTGGVLLYGVLGLAAGIGLLRRRAWSLPLAIAWGLVVTYVASTAALAFGGPGVPMSAAIAGGIGAAVIALLVVLATRAGVRDVPRARSG